mmetsp:Transcript_6195/g.10364  ORF Transcript_6195/g.10364 Transcript_6195/m.10364 type:complete len:211 (+) Transcript_6195:838-1470(+)
MGTHRTVDRGGAGGLPAFALLIVLQNVRLEVAHANAFEWIVQNCVDGVLLPHRGDLCFHHRRSSLSQPLHGHDVRGDPFDVVRGASVVSNDFIRLLQVPALMSRLLLYSLEHLHLHDVVFLVACFPAVFDICFVDLSEGCILEHGQARVWNFVLVFQVLLEGAAKGSRMHAERIFHFHEIPRMHIPILVHNEAPLITFLKRLVEDNINAL